MRLLSRPLGVVRIRWGSAAEAGVDAAAVVEVFDPGGDSGAAVLADVTFGQSPGGEVDDGIVAPLASGPSVPALVVLKR